MLEFHFGEGYVDQMIIDPKTGALLALTTRDRDDQIVGGQVYLTQDLVSSAK